MQHKNQYMINDKASTDEWIYIHVIVIIFLKDPGKTNRE